MANEHIGLYGIPSFYPTPAALAQRLIDLADIQPGDTLLEPSAGNGAIARLIRQRYPKHELLVIEKDLLLRMELLSQGFRVVGKDFFTYTGQADWVIQNPPFSNNYQDIDHFCQAWRVARKGVVSLLHEYSGFMKFDSYRYKPAVFQRWLDAVGCQRQLNPEGSFLSSEKPSAVRTCVVHGRKQNNNGTGHPADLLERRAA